MTVKGNRTTLEIVMHYDPAGAECQLMHRKKTAAIMVNGKVSRTVPLKISLILSPEDKHTIETTTKSIKYFRRKFHTDDPVIEATVITNLLREKMV